MPTIDHMPPTSFIFFTPFRYFLRRCCRRFSPPRSPCFRFLRCFFFADAVLPLFCRHDAADAGLLPPLRHAARHATPLLENVVTHCHMPPYYDSYAYATAIMLIRWLLIFFSIIVFQAFFAFRRLPLIMLLLISFAFIFRHAMPYACCHADV